MNYLGHAAVACFVDPKARFILGAMLPDLAHLGTMTLPSVCCPEAQRGVAFHVRTDSVFHEHPTFQDWQSRTTAALRRHAVRSGPARAAGHIGVEMLIDDALARHPEVIPAYSRALTLGRDQADSVVELIAPDLAEVCGLLHGFAHRAADGSRARLELRLGRALGARPRLAPTAEELEAMIVELSMLRLEVEERAEELLKDLLTHLSPDNA